MPITEELKNVKSFESVGFSHEQSETLAVVIEESHTQSQESLKEFIRNENDKLLTGINSPFKDILNEFEKQTKDFDAKLSALEVRLMVSQKDLLIKIFGIIVGTIGVAVTILKLF